MDLSLIARLKKLLLLNRQSQATRRKSSIPVGAKPPGISLSEFLATNKQGYLTAVGEGKGKEWTVVMGNEAGGLSHHTSRLL